MKTTLFSDNDKKYNEISGFSRMIVQQDGFLIFKFNIQSKQHV